MIPSTKNVDKNMSNFCLQICLVILIILFNFNANAFDDNRLEIKFSDQTKEKTNLTHWETDARLPSDIVPLHYDIILHPDLENGVFTGNSSITVKLLTTKDFIILHSLDLNIIKTKLKNLETSEEIHISKEFLYRKNEFYIIQLKNHIQPGKYDLFLNYNGSLTNKIVGFYRSSYRDVESGSIRQIATSKFEPTYARQAFPCFDEPSFKATYLIKLVRPSGNNYIALSNMNQVAEYHDQPLSGLTTVEFAKSVPMSTYLACFIVCDFDHLPSVKSKQGFPVTVYARPGQANNMQYALDLAVKTIDYYIEYFDIDYPLPKLDLIAIPDFVSGAMEHWGLVTFRETAALFNDASNSLVNKKQVSLTVAHELAHMWFGNLVTMEWWNDLWLNEGFASYIEYKGVAHSHPDWDLDTQLLIDDAHRVLSMDSALSSHPIVQTVSHPDQITEIFDTISYSKGPTIIRMLEDMMGPKAFQKGVSDYLKAFAYGNAETEDLWKMLEKHSNGINISQDNPGIWADIKMTLGILGLSLGYSRHLEVILNTLADSRCFAVLTQKIVIFELAPQTNNSTMFVFKFLYNHTSDFHFYTKHLCDTKDSISLLLCGDIKFYVGTNVRNRFLRHIMSTWTNQMGFPLINVRRFGDTLTLTQQRFLVSINTTFNENDSEFHYKWHIPLTFVTSVNATEVHRSWFYSHQPSVNITLPPGSEWFKLNYRQFGYYRVRYPTEEWQKLINMLQQNPESISAADRANLLDDAFSLAKAGYSNYKMALDAIHYLPKEKHFVPIVVATHKLLFLQSILSNTRVYVKFRKYVHKILDPVMTDSLWNISAAGSYSERRYKIVTLELGCSLRVPSCVTKAVEKFKNWLFKNGTKPEPELRSLVYMTGMSHGGEVEWDKLWQAYVAEQEPQEKAKLRNALSTVREPWLLNRYIDLAKDENNVRSQDFISLLMTISDNPVGNPIIWDFVRDQWAYLVKRFTLNNRSLGTLIPRVTSSYSTKTKLGELKAFLAANPEAGAGSAGRKIAVEKIENNIQWISANLPELITIF